MRWYISSTAGGRQIPSASFECGAAPSASSSANYWEAPWIICDLRRQCGVILGTFPWHVIRGPTRKHPASDSEGLEQSSGKWCLPAHWHPGTFGISVTISSWETDRLALRLGHIRQEQLNLLFKRWKEHGSSGHLASLLQGFLFCFVFSGKGTTGGNNKQWDFAQTAKNKIWTGETLRLVPLWPWGDRHWHMDPRPYAELAWKATPWTPHSSPCTQQYLHRSVM